MEPSSSNKPSRPLQASLRRSSCPEPSSRPLKASSSIMSGSSEESSLLSTVSDYLPKQPVLGFLIVSWVLYILLSVAFAWLFPGNSFDIFQEYSNRASTSWNQARIELCCKWHTSLNAILDTVSFGVLIWLLLCFFFFF